MGLNAKEISLCLCRVLQASYDTSYTFTQRHPLVSGCFFVFLIVYIFLSYIYNFLVYLSPFLVCTAIFIRIFWSSEQPQLRYVKREKKRNEQKHPRAAKYGRNDLVLDRYYRYSPQYAISRRRNFRERKWSLHGGIEEKADALSTACNSDFTGAVSERNTENKEVNSLERTEISAEKFMMSNRQTLRSEPSMRDLMVDYSLDEFKNRFDGCGGSGLESENLEDGEDEDEEEEAQDDRNKAVEWTEDDQRNLMDLGFSEIERNTRMETLIARRRARKLLKMQIEKGRVETKDANPSQIPPPFVTRKNPFGASTEFEEFDGLEMPGSAPSIFRPSRNPFDLSYHPSNEEKPILKGGSFHQELTGPQEDMPFCRHESFSLGPSFQFESIQDQGARARLGYYRFRRLPDKGNHDKLIEEMFSKGSDFASVESELNAGKQNYRDETSSQVDRKSETDMVDMKGEEIQNVHLTKSSVDHRTESDSTKNSNYGFSEIGQNISSVEKAGVSEKPESRVHKPPEKFINFSLSNSTNINESLFNSFPSPIDKHQENMFYTGRRICRTPTYSIASDLQVEVSEVGSPTLTVDGTNSTTDGESSLYDGDNEKDITSGSEDMWGNSIHSREVHGVSDEDIAEANNNSKYILSPFPLQDIDEENSADVSSMSSTCDLPGDTPTCAMNYDHNIFYNMKEPTVENEATQPMNSSDMSSSPKPLIGSPVESTSRGTHSEKKEPNPADEAKADIEAKKDVRRNSANLAENEVTNLAKPTAGTNSINAPTGEEVPSNSLILESFSDVHKKNEGKSQILMKQEPTVEPLINAKTKDTKSAKDSEGKHGDLKNEAIVSLTNTAQMGEDDIVPKPGKPNDMAQTTSTGELPAEVTPYNMQHLINDPSPTVQTHNRDFTNSQPNPAAKAKADIEAKDVKGNSANLTENEVINLIIPASGTSSIKAPNGEKPNPADEAKAEVEAKKDVQGNSANLAEIDVTNSKKPASGTNSINTPNKEKPNFADKTKANIEANKEVQDNFTKLAENGATSLTKTAVETISLNIPNGDKPNPADKAKADIEVRKDVQGNSAILEENEAANLTKPVAEANSINAPKGDKLNPADKAKAGIEAKKDVRGSSAILAENDGTNLTKPAAETNSINAPNVDKPNLGDKAKADIEAKKDVQGNSANLAENEVINLTKPAAGTNSINTLNGEKVPSNILIIESFHKENEDETQILMKQEQTDERFINDKTKDPRSANNSEGNHDSLNENEAILSSRSIKEVQNLSETAHSEEPRQVPELENVKADKKNDSLEEVSYKQGKSKKSLEDDMKKDQPTIGNNTGDWPPPIVNEVTISRSAEDTEGKSDIVNKREVIELELNKTEAMFSSKSVGDSVDRAKIEEDVKVPKPGKPNDSTESVEGDMEKDKTSNGKFIEDFPQSIVSEPTIPSKEANDRLAEDS